MVGAAYLSGAPRGAASASPVAYLTAPAPLVIRTEATTGPTCQAGARKDYAKANPVALHQVAIDRELGAILKVHVPAGAEVPTPRRRDLEIHAGRAKGKPEARRDA